MNLFIILPEHQFFTKNVIEKLMTMDKIYLMEDPMYFMSSKSKFIHLRSTMKYYYALLEESFKRLELAKMPKLKYIHFDEIPTSFLDYIKNEHCIVNMWWPSSWRQWEDLRERTYNGIGIQFYDSPAHLFTRKWARKQFKSRSFNTFYRIFATSLIPSRYIHHFMPGDVPPDINCNDPLAFKATRSSIKSPRGILHYKYKFDQKICLDPDGNYAPYLRNHVEARDYFIMAVKTGNIADMSAALAVGHATPGELLEIAFETLDLIVADATTAAREELISNVACMFYKMARREWYWARYCAEKPTIPRKYLANKTCIGDILNLSKISARDTEIIRIFKAATTGHLNYKDRQLLMQRFLTYGVSINEIITWFVAVMVDGSHYMAIMWLLDCIGSLN